MPANLCCTVFVVINGTTYIEIQNFQDKILIFNYVNDRSIIFIIIFYYCFFFQGANINAQDANNRTPLFVAASKRAWQSVNLLIKRGANMTLKDEKSRNFLHVIIKGGGSLNLFEDEVVKVSCTIFSCHAI